MWSVKSEIVWAKVALAIMANNKIVSVIAIMAIAAIANQIFRPKLIKPFLKIRSRVIRRFECIELIIPVVLPAGTVAYNMSVFNCYNPALQCIYDFHVVRGEQNGSTKTVNLL
jgi:hypothetical protein